ncbi:histone-lysine N-methyltransferase [Rhynchospora pubera]|uniref:Histone-lysine N-methyltransferase n=1 Tax=Rhynchospora pubera TaxID=906938 RepID=A0AAV8DM91_9POAL|nr:histone-lysine N-methyltransferase [Rhynchospora pubera]KAJ4797175.1 histone-lysine N-methyltransferase [Rhynchospora pubera]KAJ4820972.1 histone-lysine N-methyltransferase [Rhynchospora pubera]
MATTWWRRRHRAKDPLDEADDLVPLDSQEQEEMVRSFEKKHAQQSRLWRRVFAGLLLGYAGFMVYSMLHQAWFPWELKYHAYFMEDMHPGMPILFDLVAVVACLLAVKGLLQNSSSSRKFFWYSTYVGLLVSVLWMTYMLRFPKIRWDAIWLPLAPLCGASLCLYLDHLMLESLEDISKLRSYMYNYKAL